MCDRLLSRREAMACFVMACDETAKGYTANQDFTEPHLSYPAFCECLIRLAYQKYSQLDHAKYKDYMVLHGSSSKPVLPRKFFTKLSNCKMSVRVSQHKTALSSGVLGVDEWRLGECLNFLMIDLFNQVADCK